MKTHLEHKFLSIRQKCLTMENMHEVVREFELILLEKETGKNRNKAKINIGHQHDHWMELKKTLRVQTHAEV